MRKEHHWLVTIGVWVTFYTIWLILAPIIYPIGRLFAMLPLLICNATLNQIVPGKGRGGGILMAAVCITIVGGTVGYVLSQNILGKPFDHWYGSIITLFVGSAAVLTIWFLRFNPTEKQRLDQTQ